jgi:hypothetical protein
LDWFVLALLLPTPVPVGAVDLVEVVVTGWVAAPPPPRAKTWLALAVNAAATPRSSAAFDNGVMVVPFVTAGSLRPPPDLPRLPFGRPSSQ